MGTMSTKEEKTALAVDPAGDAPAQLGPDEPVRTFRDILDLHLAMIESQRKRVARAVAKEARTGELDKDTSVEIKRLNVMVATHNELVNTPQAKAGTQPRPGTGVVSQILTSLAPKKRRSRQTAPKQ
jgi:hypothetical protein